MMGNSGNLNSPNNIANVFDANRVPTNHVTVGRYISYLRDAFVFYETKALRHQGEEAYYYPKRTPCQSPLRSGGIIECGRYRRYL